MMSKAVHKQFNRNPKATQKQDDAKITYCDNVK